MSLRIIRQGILDTIQDLGRAGYQQYGVNNSGAMDQFSARLANAILGKDLGAAVLELHFPAAEILFTQATLISICGADFTATINGSAIPLDHPVAISADSTLRFHQRKQGARVYLAVGGRFGIDAWLGSYSTHLKASAGGWQGRPLHAGDELPLVNEIEPEKFLHGQAFSILPWKAQETVTTKNEISFLIGSEWSWMPDSSKESFQQSWYQISNEADRMGYRLAGAALPHDRDDMVSSAVSSGTVQLLPNGQLIVLMADHQTTGGYPRVAHVITAHLPLLAQKGPNDVIRFQMTHLEEAEEKMLKQQRYLLQLATASTYRLREPVRI